MALVLVETKRVSEMFGFRCLDCGAWFDVNWNPYWSIAKTRGLHLMNGRCKRVRMYKLEVEPQPRAGIGARSTEQ